MEKTVPEENPRVLTETQRQFVAARVADGDYEDPASVVQAGFDLLKEDEERREREFAAAVQVGMQASGRGEVIDVSGDGQLGRLMDEIHEEVAAKRRVTSGPRN